MVLMVWALIVRLWRAQWSKGKVREKKNYRVVWNNELYQKMLKEVPKKMKVITAYALVEQYKINASVVSHTQATGHRPQAGIALNEL
jgi:hypothetical protein